MPRRPKKKRRVRAGRVRVHLWQTDRGYAACGYHHHDPLPAILDIAAFAWVPARYQCQRCIRGRVASDHPQLRWTSWPDMVEGWWYPPLRQLHATHEMELTVEVTVLAIHRLGQTAHEHRCWFDDTRHRCPCGAYNLLDPVVFTSLVTGLGEMVADSLHLIVMRRQIRELELEMYEPLTPARRAGARKRLGWRVDGMLQQFREAVVRVASTHLESYRYEAKYDNGELVVGGLPPIGLGGVCRACAPRAPNRCAVDGCTSPPTITRFAPADAPGAVLRCFCRAHADLGV